MYIYNNVYYNTAFSVSLMLLLSRCTISLSWLTVPCSTKSSGSPILVMVGW